MSRPAAFYPWSHHLVRSLLTLHCSARLRGSRRDPRALYSRFYRQISQAPRHHYHITVRRAKLPGFAFLLSRHTAPYCRLAGDTTITSTSQTSLAAVEMMHCRTQATTRMSVLRSILPLTNPCTSPSIPATCGVASLWVRVRAQGAGGGHTGSQAGWAKLMLEECRDTRSSHHNAQGIPRILRSCPLFVWYMLCPARAFQLPIPRPSQNALSTS